MGFLNNIGKSLSQGIDRAKFEAEKFQKVSRIQGELAEIQKQMDTRRFELSDRAFDLYKAGKIQSSTLGEIVRAIETLRTSVTLKQEELKAAQSEVFVEPPPATPAAPQNVPINVETPTAQMPPTPTVASTPQHGAQKSCPVCGFQMPNTALFCPSCGNRVGT